MAITLIPQFDPASIYQPVVYKVERQATQPQSVAYVEVNVRFEGVTFATDKKEPTEIVDLGGGVFNYIFEVDVSAYLQRYLAPNREKSSMFGELSGLDYSVNSDAFGELVVFFLYAIEQADGIIDDPAFQETATPIDCAIAKRQNGELRSLDQFFGPLIQFLTKRPQPFTTSPNCASFLSFYNDQVTMNCMRLVLLDSLGATVSTNYTQNAFSATDQNTAAVGYENIDASLSNEWLNGDDKPNLSNAASYLVDFGTVTTDIDGNVLSYTALTEQVLYEIDPICNKKLKLFWLNDLGGVDDYTLPFVSLNAVIGSDSFEKPLAWDAGAASPHAQYDYGRLRNNITAQRKYTIETRVAPSVAKWLRELLTSAEIYLVNPEDATELWRVWPDPNTYTERVGYGLVSIGFDLNLAQDYVIHRV